MEKADPIEMRKDVTHCVPINDIGRDKYVDELIASIDKEGAVFQSGTKISYIMTGDMVIVCIRVGQTIHVYDCKRYRSGYTSVVLT